MSRPSAPNHSPTEDLQGGVTSVVLVSLGLALLNSAGLVTGGVPGMGFLLSYATGLPLGLALVLVSLPFFALGWVTMGRAFSLRSLAAVGGLALGVELLRHGLTLQAAPAYAALAGGLVIGVGLLVMFRHGASYGGVNILALALERRRGWPVGKVQLAVDGAILAASFGLIDAQRVAWSVLGTVAINAVLIWNHRPGRYVPAAAR